MSGASFMGGALPTSGALLTIQDTVNTQTATEEKSASSIAPPVTPGGVLGWLRRAVRDEDILSFLLGVRWISLIPPALSLLLRDESPLVSAYAPYVLLVAILCNIGLSVWHPLADRLLVRHPWLIAIDLFLVALFLALTGGPVSQYRLYALTPLLASAFFFGMRGGALAALSLTAFYLVSLLIAPPVQLIFSEVTSQIMAFFIIAIMFGYQAVLLQRLRAANDELQHAQEDVQRATTLAALGKTIAHVSHEIRNPLVTLGGFARQLIKQPENTDKVLHHATIMAEEISRLETLLTDVLAVARPPQLKLARGNLHEVLDQACLLASGASAGRITIEKDYDPSLPWLRMNAPALLRAFLNVARNAVQAMPEGGTLRISTRYIGEREMVEVNIADSGPGIPDAILCTVFEPFVSHKENGTGLGLAIAHQIVHEHSGTIKAVNVPEGGARFTIYLPLVPRETPE